MIDVWSGRCTHCDAELSGRLIRGSGQALGNLSSLDLASRQTKKRECLVITPTDVAIDRRQNNADGAEVATLAELGRLSMMTEFPCCDPKFNFPEEVSELQLKT